MKKIYCAGPLFNQIEKNEMKEISEHLKSHGFDTFLPQEDGLEYANLYEGFRKLNIEPEKADCVLRKAIFILDVFQILNSHGFVLNLNGRVPDEGAMVEAGIAWSSGKVIVTYKNDSRSLINGYDNPLVLGLTNFYKVNKIEDISSNLIRLFDEKSSSIDKKIDNTNLQTIYNLGEKITCSAYSVQENLELCKELINILEFDYAESCT